MIGIVRDLIDLKTEFVISRVRLLHAVDLGIQTGFQFPVSILHCVDILICRRVGRRDHCMPCALDQGSAASEACCDQKKDDSCDADHQKYPAVPHYCVPDDGSRS